MLKVSRHLRTLIENTRETRDCIVDCPAVSKMDVWSEHGISTSEMSMSRKLLP